MRGSSTSGHQDRTGRVGSFQERTGIGRKDTSSGFLVGNLVAWKGLLRRRRSEPEKIRTHSWHCFRTEPPCMRASSFRNSNRLSTSRSENRTYGQKGRRGRDFGGRAGWQPSFLRSVEAINPSLHRARVCRVSLRNRSHFSSGRGSCRIFLSSVDLVVSPSDSDLGLNSDICIL